MDASTVVDVLSRAVPDASVDALPSIDMATVAVDREHPIDACRALRDDPTLQFSLLVDATAVDFFPAEPRYEVVYHLACVGPAYAQSSGAAQASRLRLKVRIPGADPRLASVTPIWPAANWLEREVFDLFGLVFDGHPDLRRILMTDDWQGHPLRKDYPVQIRKETSSAMPLQMTPEQFAANVRAVRDDAVDQSKGGPFDERRRAASKGARTPDV
jgi:NADH-quinone oxidoreductase subunit C